MKKTILSLINRIGLIALLFLSRLLLASRTPDFFDATQYLWRVSDSSLLGAMSSGHPPFHPLYLFFGNIFYKFFALFNTEEPVLALVLPSAIFGSLAVIVFYFLVRDIFNDPGQRANFKVCLSTDEESPGQSAGRPAFMAGRDAAQDASRLPSLDYARDRSVARGNYVSKVKPAQDIALLSAIIISIIPFFWISNITILVDATGIFFLLLAFYGYWRGLNQEKKARVLWIAGAGLAFGLAIFTHTALAIWAPAFLGLFIYKEWRDGFKWPDLLSSFLLVIGPLIFILAYAVLLTRSGLYAGAGEATRFLILGNIQDRAAFSFVKIAKYTWFVATTPLLLLALLGLAKMLWRRTRRVVILIAWICPLPLAALFIYENLYGRAIIPALFAFAVLAAYFITSFKKRWVAFSLAGVALVLILITSWPAVIKYHFTSSPNNTLPEFESKMEEGSLLVGTAQTRTWHDEKSGVEFARFGDVDITLPDITAAIFKHAEQKQITYLASDAIFWPFWRWDGHYFDIRSGSITNQNRPSPPISPLFEGYRFDLALSDSRYNKFVLRETIITDLPARVAYSLDNLPKNQNIVLGRLADPAQGQIARALILLHPDYFYINSENILARDPGYRLWRLAENQSDPLLWSLTDRQGLFLLPVTANPENAGLTVINEPSSARLINGSHLFVQKQEINLNALAGEKRLGLSQEELLGQISRLAESQSFYALKHAPDNFDLIIFTYPDLGTDKLEAESMDHQISRVITEADASGQEVREASSGQSGYLVTGPYITLEPGAYRLIARIKTGQAKNNEELGLLDIAAQNGQNIIASKEIYSAGEENYRDIEIDFILKEKMSGIEFRVYSEGKGEMSVDYIMLSEQD